MHGWAVPFQAQGWPLEADPADPQGVLLKADRLAPLRIRYDGFFFRIERELEGRGTPPHLLAVTEGLPYLKLLRSRQGLKVRAEITVPERIWRVLEALAMLRARWEGQEVRSPAGEAVAPRQLELLLRPWAEARGGRYRAQAGGGVLQVPGHYPLEITGETPGLRLRLAFWPFQMERPPAWDEWLLAIQPHLRFIKATPEGLGCDLPGEALAAREWELALVGIQAAEARFRQAAEALQEPTVAAIYGQLVSFPDGNEPIGGR